MSGETVGGSGDTTAQASLPELTWQAVVGAFLVSSLVALSYPYIVLKLGLGFNASLLAAFLGALFLHVSAARTRGSNRLMNNVIQTAGTSATSTAFMCVVAAAFGYLGQNQSVDVHVTITPLHMFLWLICSGCIGVLFIPVFRRYFLNDPEMVFADGVAAAETIRVLDSDQGDTRRKLRLLGISGVVSGITSFAVNVFNFPPPLYIIKRFQIGIEWSLLSFGIGLQIGPRVSLSIGLGTLIMALAGPTILARDLREIINSGIAQENIAACDRLIGADNLTSQQNTFATNNCGMLSDYLQGDDFSILILWTMWPATALIIAAGLTAVALQWRSIGGMFRTLFSGRREEAGEDVSLRTTFLGVAVLATVLAFVQNFYFGMSYLETFAAVVIELPLMLIGVRVLGATNFGPVSVTANSLQVIFALLWPQRIAHNLVAAGIAGDGNSQAEGTMQDFRTGQRVGSTPRLLTYVQLCAIPIGAAAVAIMYPLLVNHYGLGGDGLTAPTGLKMANMAVLLTKGFSALPGGALFAAIGAAVVGIVVTVFEARGDGFRWLPSPAALGFGLILPGLLTVPLAIGGVLGWAWSKRSPETYERYRFTVVAGLVAGDALISGVFVPILASLGLLPSP